MTVDPTQGQEEPGRDSALDELAAALMNRWGADDGDEDAYDAARADAAVVCRTLIERMDEIEGVRVPYSSPGQTRRCIWLHTADQIETWLEGIADA